MTYEKQTAEVNIMALLLKLPEHIEKHLEAEAKLSGLSISEYILSRLNGITPPRNSSGTYEDIMAVTSRFTEIDESDDFYDAIMENRRMRRELAQED